MAIKLTKTDSKGVITRYHRVCEFTVYPDTIHATVESYVNNKTREAQKDAMGDFYYSKDTYFLDYNGTDKICVDCIYERLMKTPDFAGGEKI